MLFLEWLFGFIWRSVLKLRDYYWYCFKYILLTEERRQGDLVVEFKWRGYQRKSGIVRQMDLGRLHVQQRKWRKSWINDRNRKVLTWRCVDCLLLSVCHGVLFIWLFLAKMKQQQNSRLDIFPVNYCHLNFPATCVWVYLKKSATLKQCQTRYSAEFLIFIVLYSKFIVFYRFTDVIIFLLSGHSILHKSTGIVECAPALTQWIGHTLVSPLLSLTSSN